MTDDEISYAAIGTRETNPLGTCILDCYVDGIEAYFAFRNSEGGIFGRDLVVGEELDDGLGQNQAKSLEVISADDQFGVFQAPLLATGFGDLDDAGIPTYNWGIHATEAANRTHIFPSTVIQCADCTGRGRAVPGRAGREVQGRRPRLRRHRQLQGVHRRDPAVRRALQRGHGHRERVLQRRADASRASRGPSAPSSPP